MTWYLKVEGVSCHMEDISDKSQFMSHCFFLFMTDPETLHDEADLLMVQMWLNDIQHIDICSYNHGI